MGVYNSAIKFMAALEKLSERAKGKITDEKFARRFACCFQAGAAGTGKATTSAGRPNAKTSGWMSHSRLRNSRAPPTLPLKEEDMRFPNRRAIMKRFCVHKDVPSRSRSEGLRSASGMQRMDGAAVLSFKDFLEARVINLPSHF